MRSTAGHAREAAELNRMLFTYPELKADPSNQSFLGVGNGDGRCVSLAGDRGRGPGRLDSTPSAWSVCTRWATVTPGQRAAQALLARPTDITPETRAAADRAIM